jgi:hypothetical protein
MAKVEGYEVGAYLGEFDLQARKSKVWGETEGKKLVDIKRQWDPEGRFCGYLGIEESNISVDLEV